MTANSSYTLNYTLLNKSDDICNVIEIRVESTFDAHILIKFRSHFLSTMTFHLKHSLTSSPYCFRKWDGLARKSAPAGRTVESWSCDFDHFWNSWMSKELFSRCLTNRCCIDWAAEGERVATERPSSISPLCRSCYTSCSDSPSNWKWISEKAGEIIFAGIPNSHHRMSWKMSRKMSYLHFEIHVSRSFLEQELSVKDKISKYTIWIFDTRWYLIIIKQRKTTQNNPRFNAEESIQRLVESGVTLDDEREGGADRVRGGGHSAVARQGGTDSALKWINSSTIFRQKKKLSKYARGLDALV